MRREEEGREGQEGRRTCSIHVKLHVYAANQTKRQIPSYVLLQEPSHLSTASQSNLDMDIHGPLIRLFFDSGTAEGEEHRLSCVADRTNLHDSPSGLSPLTSHLISYVSK